MNSAISKLVSISNQYNIGELFKYIKIQLTFEVSAEPLEHAGGIPVEKHYPSTTDFGTLST
jgi:hypothetical protein